MRIALQGNPVAGKRPRPGLVGVAPLAVAAPLQQVEQWKLKACFLLSAKAEAQFRAEWLP